MFMSNNTEEMEIFNKIDQEYLKVKKEMKGKSVHEILKIIIQNLLNSWKENGSNHDDIKKIIEMIPMSKLINEITYIKENFEWKHLPIWNQRREKLLELLKIPLKKDFNTDK